MSKKDVQGAHVRLNPENLKELQKFQQEYPLPITINSLANTVINFYAKVCREKFAKLNREINAKP